MFFLLNSFYLFFYRKQFSPRDVSVKKKMAESEEEVDVLVQRVVKDISNAFKRNPNM